ncbi:Short-chain dehydrogenase/reductase SDR [Penicillium griseofulvum]|uniref:Short-chain dehydrogenase/reductase SDR n=1 Tax=Penicillium patulum TaxID=5078 RepID=A0A135LWC1_PENPA|nr:Short-chain dehydrogenase/reductase SDR [Penicillium griseofulvum]KXG53211.1 Short-chain dehydrogenase/reductase SDR [Penicillium griseofulvum]
MAPWIFSVLNDLFQAGRGTNTTFLTDQQVPGADLTGKWIIITGSNNGVGFEAAKSFASWGANLILACREPPAWEQHPTAAVNECKDLATANGHSSTIEWWAIDMADLSSVEAFAQKWLQCDRALDILCNNAGIAEPTQQTRITKDGFQAVHQINFLSHVLLTLRLLPSLARSAEPRVICTTSCYHHLGLFDLDHVNGEPGSRGNDYRNNKLYFQMWVVEMQSRLLKRPEYLHITINGVHPGFVASGIWDGLANAGGTPSGLNLLLRYVAITTQQGGLAISHAATSAEFGPDPKRQGVSAGNGRGGGKYINRIWEAPMKSHCNDPEARSRLWIKLDEELGLQEKGLLKGLGL